MKQVSRPSPCHAHAHSADCHGTLFIGGFLPGLKFHHRLLNAITVNIHTHLWGAVVFFMLVLSLKTPSQFLPWGISAFDNNYELLSSSVTWEDTFVFAMFFLGGMNCLGFSAMFHTFSCHSHKVCSTFGRLDYIGIVWLTIGSFYPSIYYGFFCHRKLIVGYLTLITILGGFATYTVVTPHYRSSDGRKKRTLVFIALGLSGIVPIGHGIFCHGLLGVADRLGLWWLLASGVAYIFGALFYAERFPERLNPGYFDIIGSSHQIFHCLILIAASFHYVAISKAFAFAHNPAHSLCL
ncbi:hypothetical protein O181_042560 [Austropuccinia psidii MF-1]|uniref:Uncharacterized protein n=1 Tax=Austropuccinia psidii MF-1 TaxID=1389203 RepID=A0A9Q3DGV6_9BASI|nr:hypothetical protein [Austropuccinia psidii MF-1]